MRLFKKENIKAFSAPKGEVIIQYVGRLEKNGGSLNHSLAIMKLLPNASSDTHCHEIAEECFLFLQGSGLMEVNGEKFEVSAGDCVLVHPGEQHTVTNLGNEVLECVITTSPAWQPTDSIK